MHVPSIRAHVYTTASHRWPRCLRSFSYRNRYYWSAGQVVIRVTETRLQIYPCPPVQYPIIDRLNESKDKSDNSVTIRRHCLGYILKHLDVHTFNCLRHTYMHTCTRRVQGVPLNRRLIWYYNITYVLIALALQLKLESNDSRGLQNVYGVFDEEKSRLNWC